MTKINLKKISVNLAVLALFVLPALVALGQGASVSSSGAPVNLPTGAPVGSGVSNFKIENPIKATNFEQFLADILNIIVQIGIPILVLMTIYTGFTFVTAAGDPGKIKQAKSMFFNLIIGAFIVLGCFAISEALTNTVADLGPITVPGIGS